MFGMYGDGLAEVDLGLDELIDEDPPPSTQRTPGSATLVVDDRYDALFTSATWTLVAKVKNSNGELIIEQSSPTPTSHTASFIRRWARALIRQNKVKLRKMGVDVEQTYLGWGGIVEDLEG
jgi:hypothetical protein